MQSSQTLNQKSQGQTPQPEKVFYSREWRKSGIKLVKSGNPIDILINDEYLYLIDIPEKRTASTVSAAVGYHLFSTLGALAGASFGESYDEESRSEVRSSWINENNELISDSFQKHVMLQVPVSELDSAVSFNLLGVTISYNNQSTTLSRRRKRPLIGRSKEKDRELAGYLQKITGKDFSASFEVPITGWGIIVLSIAIMLLLYFIG